MLIAGIDEAGRGPCFGPMTISIAVIEKSTEKELKSLGVKDSKELTAKKREEMFEKVKSLCVEQNTLHVPPIEINDLMVRESLNEIEAIKIGELINSLKTTPDVIYIDSPDATAGKFEGRIRAYLSKEKSKIKIIAENKADANYVVVGAASIIAKVSRDHAIEELCEKYGDFGSGYPSDPKTIKYLNDYVKEHKKLPPFSRIFWKNCVDALNTIGQRKLEM